MRGMSLLRASAAAPLVALISAADAALADRTGEVAPQAVPTGAAGAAIEAMNNRFYNSTDGRWGTSNAWWLSGIALQNVIDYMLVTGNQDYLPQVEHTIELQKAPVDWWPKGGGYFRADSTDDTAWWGLAMVSLYDLTNSTEYLDIARLDEEYIYKYWNTSTCDGGLIWNIPRLEYKNAIGNEQYVKLAAALHNRIPEDEKYLQRAKKTWEWFRDSGLINSESLINDGLTEEANGACTNNGQTTWTYNQGVILGGLTELYHATGNKEYLTVARSTADAVLASDALSPNGILKEPCDAEEGCHSDQAAFKGIFAKNLAELNAALDGRPYSEYLARNAESAWQNARNNNDLYCVSWSGPFDKFTIGSQTSAVSLLLYSM